MEFPLYTSSNGTIVRIYCVTGAGDFPVHGAYWTGEEWIVKAWDLDGKAAIGRNSPLDIQGFKP